MPPRSAIELSSGIVAILPAAIAVVPFALILGANGAQKGLSVIEVVLMSGLVFAGSSQFLAIDLWTDPAPWVALGLAALLVNLRHVLMSASLAGKMGAFGRAGRFLAIFFLADEIWAVAERRALERPLTVAFFVGVAGLLYANWLLWTGVGAAVGSLVSDPRAYGFDFAFTAIFIGLIAGFWRGMSSIPVVVASAAVATLVHSFVPGAWFVIAGALAGIAVAAMLPSVGQAEGGSAAS